MPRESALPPLRESTPPARESGSHKVPRERRSTVPPDENEMEAAFADLAREFQATPLNRRSDSDDLEADLPLVDDDEFDPTQQIARVKANEQQVEARAQQRREARIARQQMVEPEPEPIPASDVEVDEVAQKVSRKTTEFRRYKDERAEVKARGEKAAPGNFQRMKKDFPLGRRFDVAIGAPERVGKLPVQRLDQNVLEDWEEPMVKSRRVIPQIPKLKTVSRPEAPKKSPVPELPAFVRRDQAKNRIKLAAQAPRVLIKDRAAIGAPPEYVNGLPVERLDESVLEDLEEPVIAKKSPSIFSRLVSWFRSE